jgi:hypothetical protein
MSEDIEEAAVVGEDFPDEDAVEGEGDVVEEHEGIIETMIERMRGTGVGLEDPNIIGDAGPTDVAPGRDPDSWPPPELLEPDPEAETAP